MGFSVIEAYLTHQSTGDWKYALLVGGYSAGEMTENVEVLSLDLESSSVPECMRSLSGFPSTLALAYGGLNRDGRPFVCGGYHDWEPTSKCFIHHPNDSWVESGSANTTRTWAGSDFSAEFGGLIIAGGHDVASAAATDVVEITADGESFETLLPLPAANAGLCVVITGNDSLFFAGGETEDGLTPNAYTYTMGDASWTQVSDMGSASRHHRCGLVHGGEGKEVVVAGLGMPGTGDPNGASVEIYNMSSGIWRSAHSISFTPLYSSTLSYGNSFALVGGWYMGDGVNAWTYDESNGVWYGLTEQQS